MQEQKGSSSPSISTLSIVQMNDISASYDSKSYVLKDIYGADALLPTTAEMHIGNFGQYLDLLPGIEKATFDKKNYSIPK